MLEAGMKGPLSSGCRGYLPLAGWARGLTSAGGEVVGADDGGAGEEVGVEVILAAEKVGWGKGGFPDSGEGEGGVAGEGVVDGFGGSGGGEGEEGDGEDCAGHGYLPLGLGDEFIFVPGRTPNFRCTDRKIRPKPPIDEC